MNSSDKISRNRLGVILNGYQGKHKKILCVCSAGCLRSPTAAHILSSPPFDFNTRAAGIAKEYAIVHADKGLVAWADEIVVMDEDHAKYINEVQTDLVNNDSVGFNIYGYKPVHILRIEDDYGYRDPELVRIMTDKFMQIFKDDLKIPVV